MAQTTKLSFIIILLICYSACYVAENKDFINAMELKKFLDRQPINTPDKPINISIKINNFDNLEDFIRVINYADKYISLDLSQSTITDIQDHLKHCWYLVNIILPDYVAGNISSESFFGCSNLASININPNNNFYSSEDGVLYNKDKTKLIIYPRKKAGGTFNIPDTVTTITEGAFLSSENLFTIKIPSNVTIIEDKAFFLCKNITNLTIPSSIEFIGDQAFFGCDKLLNPVNTIAGTEEDIWVHNALEICADVGQFFHDINEDGKNNCQDMAIMFYAYYTARGGDARIIVNEPINHMFIHINVKDEWHAIEPGAYIVSRKPQNLLVNKTFNKYPDYYMHSIWNKDEIKYDKTYDTDVTIHYLQAINNARQLLKSIHAWGRTIDKYENINIAIPVFIDR